VRCAMEVLDPSCGGIDIHKSVRTDADDVRVERGVMELDAVFSAPSREASRSRPSSR
jgi:hypothetical protein